MTEHRPRALWIAFKEGILWNYAHDEETVVDWMDRGLIEAWAKYESVGPLVLADDH